MRCPHCKSDKLQFFNEPSKVRDVKFNGVAAFLLILSIVLIVAGVLNFVKMIVESKELVAILIATIMAVPGFLFLIIFIIYMLIPKYKTVHQIKVLCTDCGYQFYLAQDDKRTVEIDPTRQNGAARLQISENKHIEENKYS